jgi:hypothetical protein
MTVALRAQVFEQLNEIILVAVQPQFSQIRSQDIHVPHFSGFFSDATQLAENPAIVKFALEADGLDRGFQTAGVRT